MFSHIWICSHKAIRVISLVYNPEQLLGLKTLNNYANLRTGVMFEGDIIRWLLQSKHIPNKHFIIHNPSPPNAETCMALGS